MNRDDGKHVAGLSIRNQLFISLLSNCVVSRGKFHNTVTWPMIMHNPHFRHAVSDRWILSCVRGSKCVTVTVLGWAQTANDEGH